MISLFSEKIFSGGHPRGSETGFHDGGLEEMAQGAAQTQTVKTRQNTCNGVAESVKKGWRNAGRNSPGPPTGRPKTADSPRLA